MLRFIRNMMDSRVHNHIELISIHVPKTAGTSFRDTLRDVYGAEHVRRLDIADNKLHLDQQPFDENVLPKKVKVVHGHMYYSLFQEKFQMDRRIPIVTWLRDPVERVISNYNYLSKRLAEELNEEEKGLNILAKMRRTLLEYARDEINRNRMSKFLDGIEPDALFFIGITDHYSEDLRDLARLLGWKDFAEHRHNITGTTSEGVDEVSKAEIRALNQLDEKLYQSACVLRHRRRKSAK